MDRRSVLPDAVCQESMLADPAAPKSRADRILKDTEGGESLVGQERCRLRIHNRLNLAQVASRRASCGYHNRAEVDLSDSQTGRTLTENDYGCHNVRAVHCCTIHWDADHARDAAAGARAHGGRSDLSTPRRVWRRGRFP